MITVINTPWPRLLPNGTEIVKTEPREGKTGHWFKRADGKIIVNDNDEADNEDKDGKFKLFTGEFQEEK